MISGIINKIIGVVDKFIPSAEKKQEMQMELIKMTETDEDFRKFAIQYEGEYKLLPKAMQVVRASIRPIFTIWVLVLFNLMLFMPKLAGEFVVNLQRIPSQMWVLFTLIIGFWFGGRAVNQAIDTAKKWGSK